MNYVGVDLGKARDHTAFAVVSRADYPNWMASAGQPLMLRQAGRAPLGTPYPRVVEGIRRIVSHPEMAGQTVVAVDATGVGAPVVDMMRGAGFRCEICAVTITSGGRENQSGGMWNVPKLDLMSGLQVSLENGELKIARELRELEALVRELLDVQVSARGTGKSRIGADGAGQHDDLAIALALAVWRAKRKQIGFVGQGRVV